MPNGSVSRSSAESDACVNLSSLIGGFSVVDAIGYVRGSDGAYVAYGIVVLTATGAGIAGIHAFGDADPSSEDSHTPAPFD